MDTIPFLITITLGELTGELDDITRAFTSVDAKADYIFVRDSESPMVQMVFLMRKGPASARALDAAQITHARREMLFISASSEQSKEQVKNALADAGIVIDLEFPLKREPQAVILGVSRLNEAWEICRQLGVLEGTPETGLSTPVMPDGQHVMPDIPRPEPTTAHAFVRRGAMRGAQGDATGPWSILLVLFSSSPSLPMRSPVAATSARSWLIWQGQWTTTPRLSD